MKPESQTAYPLAWPAGWPRTPYHKRETSHRFGGSIHGLTFDRARRQLQDELGRLGARNVVISTNVPLRQDGNPYAGAATARMDDPGVAVYFTLRDRPLSMARDGYANIAANMRSLFLAIDGMRQLERHGGSYMMERAFSGFTALPPPQTCWQILGIPKGSAENIRKAFKEQAQRSGAGGNIDMGQLVKARDEALKEIANG